MESTNLTNLESIHHPTSGSSREDSPQESKSEKEDRINATDDAKAYKPKSKRLYEMWQQEKDEAAADIFNHSDMVDEYNSLKDMLWKKGIEISKYFKWSEFEKDMISKMEVDANVRESNQTDSTFDLKAVVSNMKLEQSASPEEKSVSTSTKTEVPLVTETRPVKRQWSLPDIDTTQMNPTPDSRSSKIAKLDLMPMRLFLLHYLTKMELKTMYEIHKNNAMKANSESNNKNVIRTCLVCFAVSTGLHYGKVTCEGCKGFFKRAIQGRQLFDCSGLKDNNCDIYSKEKRNVCKKCRFRKCLMIGMAPAAVRENHMPGGRNSQAVYIHDYSISDDELETPPNGVSKTPTGSVFPDNSRPTSQSFSSVPKHSPPDLQFIPQQPRLPSIPYSPFTSAASAINNFVPASPQAVMTSPRKLEDARMVCSSRWMPKCEPSSSSSSILDVISRNPGIGQNFLRRMITESPTVPSTTRVNLTKKAMLDEMIAENAQSQFHKLKSEAPSPSFTTPTGKITMPFLRNLMIPSVSLPSRVNQQPVNIPLTIPEASPRLMTNNGGLPLASMFTPTQAPLMPPHHFPQVHPRPTLLNQRCVPPVPPSYPPVSPMKHPSTPNNSLKPDLNQPSILRDLIMPSPQDLSNTTSTVPAPSSPPSYCSVLENLMKGKDNLNIDKLSQCIATLENQCLSEDRSHSELPDTKNITLLTKEEIIHCVNANVKRLHEIALDKPPFDISIAYEKIIQLMTERYGKLFGTDARFPILLFNVSILIHFSNFWTQDPIRGSGNTRMIKDEVVVISEYIKTKLWKLAYIITNEIESLLLQVAEISALLMTVSGDPQQVFEKVISAYLHLHQNGTTTDQKLVKDMNDILQKLTEILPKIHPFLVMTINRICSMFEIRTD